MHTQIVIDIGRRPRAMLRPFDGFDDFDDFDDDAAYDDDLDWDGAFDEADGFDRILTVVRAAARLPDGRYGLRTVPHSRLNNKRALRQIFRRRLGGVFLRGATVDQARSWAQQMASRIPGARVVSNQFPQGEQHRGGVPHFHIQRPDGQRSAHIFYGQTPPSGVFFDHPY
jgi:hypothetical protein